MEKRATDCRLSPENKDLVKERPCFGLYSGLSVFCDAGGTQSEISLIPHQGRPSGGHGAVEAIPTILMDRLRADRL